MPTAPLVTSSCLSFPSPHFPREGPRSRAAMWRCSREGEGAGASGMGWEVVEQSKGAISMPPSSACPLPGETTAVAMAMLPISGHGHRVGAAPRKGVSGGSGFAHPWKGCAGVGTASHRGLMAGGDVT